MGMKKARREGRALREADEAEIGISVGAVSLGDFGLFVFGGFFFLFLGGVLEFLDRLAQPAGETGQFRTAEEDQKNDQDDQKFAAADAERCENCRGVSHEADGMRGLEAVKRERAI